MAMLTAVTGIGRGTAEVFLLFMLDREDIWPAHDVALQEAARRLFGLAKRPDVKAMDAMAEAWRPHRGVAARLLWRYYGMTQRRRSEEHTSELQSLMRISYAVFCLKKKTINTQNKRTA